MAALCRPTHICRAVLLSLLLSLTFRAAFASRIVHRTSKEALQSYAVSEGSGESPYPNRCASGRCPKARRTDSEGRFLDYLTRFVSSSSGLLLDDIIRVQLAQPFDAAVQTSFIALPVGEGIASKISYLFGKYSWDIVNTVVLLTSSAYFIYIFLSDPLSNVCISTISSHVIASLFLGLTHDLMPVWLLAVLSFVIEGALYAVLQYMNPGKRSQICVYFTCVVKAKLVYDLFAVLPIEIISPSYTGPAGAIATYVYGTSNFMAVRLNYAILLLITAAAIFRKLPPYVSGAPSGLHEVDLASSTKRKMVCLVGAWPLAALIPQVLCTWLGTHNPIGPYQFFFVPTPFRLSAFESWLALLKHFNRAVGRQRRAVVALVFAYIVIGIGVPLRTRVYKSDPGRGDKSKKGSTVSFGGPDGRVLNFVVATTEGGSTQGDESAPTWTRLWKRKAPPSAADKAHPGPQIAPVNVEDVKESDTKTGPSDADANVGGGHPKRAKQAPATIAQPHTTARTDTDPSSSDDYFKKEDEFMLRQELEKSKLRVKDGRGNELDNLLVSGTPVTSVVDLFDGDDDATLLQHLELLKAHLHFCEDDSKRSLIKALETIVNSRRLGDVAGEVSQSVSSKINSILSTKSVSELEGTVTFRHLHHSLGYESEIRKKMTSDDVVDTNFWEAVLSRIPFFKACCVVRDHNKGAPADNLAASNVKPVTPKAPASRADGSVRAVADPKYERFMKALKLETDEHMLTEDVPYGKDSGRKPQFAARVTLSYDWNSYNLSHFDPNNPPPKSVQGFKFSIFFSNLENPRAVPQWKLAKDGANTDTCLLVFKGGRPYAPVAFRIPAREWDTDPSRGFKNCFSEGVLHLYFNFRKLTYRR
ncbi:-Uncharacterized protein C19orf29 homolog [Babesia bigemina]|uniref:Splicing factor Cactin n=1 Tax=Babesia bigemina TaxID=5866 RepID=A0A061DBC6_BABBI|nr:-Uncharacterized protein C19orf29 homolog [Babesia bigemina]CDR98001.1 -Uncharacterized protein C19orf29 homolog [Babesia bigemina]|eukprot:XP_012770187.1 -Uncharacterized protein C19orf29 homolog [Babesia bigemina]